MLTALSPEPPSGWSVFVHPDGGLYFSKLEVFPVNGGATDDLQEVPILTDMYVYDTEILLKLDEYIEKIIKYITTHNVKLPSDTCLVLELRLSGRCGYYFVDHTQKCVYWLDEFDARAYLDEVRVEYTPSHIGKHPSFIHAAFRLTCIRTHDAILVLVGCSFSFQHEFFLRWLGSTRKVSLKPTTLTKTTS